MKTPIQVKYPGALSNPAAIPKSYPTRLSIKRLFITTVTEKKLAEITYPHNPQKDDINP